MSSKLGGRWANLSFDLVYDVYSPPDGNPPFYLLVELHPFNPVCLLFLASSPAQSVLPFPSMEHPPLQSSLFFSCKKNEDGFRLETSGVPTASTARGISSVYKILINILCTHSFRASFDSMAGHQTLSSTILAPTNATDHPSCGRPYDVFLNHRGPDVKKTLAGCIYLWLQDKGSRVFLDKEEFQAGGGLHRTTQTAIGSASVHIAISLWNYAECSWCFDEFKSGAKIIPVFVDVRPSDLRWIGKGKGLYAHAFAEHRKKRRVIPQRLDQWTEALAKVSYLYGLELYGAEFQGDLGKLLKSLKSLSDTVLEVVVEKVPLDICKDPVGPNEAVQDLQNSTECEQQSKDEAVKILGVVGLGGSGKTTLTKQIYNLQRSSCNGSSFLFDVRHASARQKIQSLQSKLLNNLLHINGINIGGMNEGRAIFRTKSHSSTPRVLIVLNDIDHENQVEDLLMKEALGSGGLILIISDDKGLETPPFVK